MGKVLKLLIILGILLLTLIGFVKFSSLLAFLWVFPWVIEKLTGIGLHNNMAQAIAIPISIALLFGVGYILSWKAKKRFKGYIIVGSMFFLWSILLFFVEKDYNFDPQTGKALVWVADTPYGPQEVPRGSKVHPVWGTLARELSSKEATQLEIQKHPLLSIDQLDPNMKVAFFGYNGEPMVWYYEHPDGTIELFTHPGFHPRLGVTLNPINPTIAEKIMANLDKINRANTTSNSAPQVLQNNSQPLHSTPDVPSKSKIKDGYTSSSSKVLLDPEQPKKNGKVKQETVSSEPKDILDKAESSGQPAKLDIPKLERLQNLKNFLEKQQKAKKTF
jgi:hypothetical protein